VYFDVPYITAVLLNYIEAKDNNYTVLYTAAISEE
jgi:hypothetical protein